MAQHGKRGGVTEKKTRYGGIEPEEAKDPFPEKGKFRFRVVSFEEGIVREHDDVQNVRLTVEIVSTKSKELKECVGENRFVPFRVRGRGAKMGKGRMKAFIVAAAGYATNAEYDAIDPHGYMIEAFLGYRGKRHKEFKGHTLVGRLVDCVVMQGNEMIDQETGQPTGEFFMNYAWSPVADDEQD